MLTSEGTVPHMRPVPSDDRPDYLRNHMGYLLALDTETDGTEWWNGHRPFIVTASDYDRDWLYRVEDPQDMRSLVMAIMTAGALVFHNAQFDVHMLVAAGVIDLDEVLDRPIYDTYIVAKVLLGEGNMTGSHMGKFGLKELAAHFVDADALEPEREMKRMMKDMGLITRADQKNLPDGVYKELWRVHPEVVETYAMRDTRLTYDLYQVLMQKLDAPDNAKKAAGHHQAIAIEHAVLPELIRMEHRGVALDRGVVDDLFQTYSKHLQDLEMELQDAWYDTMSVTEGGDEDMNPDATKDVVALLEAHGVVITEVTEKGFIRTDRKTLEAYQDVSVVRTLLDYRRTSKFLRTYLEPMKNRDTVHPSFQQLGAWTGRMSCRRPNMQNIPVRDAESARLREMFVPRPGYALISADYDRVEPVLLAWYMNDLDLMNQFLDGDPYLDAGEIYHGHRRVDEWTVPRMKFKNGFLATTYASGVEKMATTLDVSVSDAKRVRDAILQLLGPTYSNSWFKTEDGEWGRTYSGFGDGFVQKARNKIRVTKRNPVPDGYVTTIGGATHRIEPDKHYVAPNTIIQGGASAIMKVGLARAAETLRPYDGHLLLVVHDELLAEVPTPVAEYALEEMRYAMESAADLAPNGKLRLATTGAVCYRSWTEAK